MKMNVAAYIIMISPLGVGLTFIGAPNRRAVRKFLSACKKQFEEQQCTVKVFDNEMNVIVEQDNSWSKFVWIKK